MLAFATGTNLDHLGALLGVARLVLDPGQPENGIAPTYESDVAFRRRIQLAPEGFSVAGPEGAYIYHALSAAADVMDASATSPAPGQVLVTVQSRTGDGAAPKALLDEAHRIGRDVPESAIKAKLFADGVQRVELDWPAADIRISRTQVAYCAAIDIVHAGVDE
ncbi:phage-related baseplate assembly protein [Xanthomonas arboricola]|nr:phage-related baseplate assembly protein [Xanthomonas euroxanthea]